MLAFTMINLGTALIKAKKEPDLAIEMLEGALGIAEDLGDVLTRLAAQQHLAEALAQAGRPDDALAAAKAQHAEAERIGYVKLEIEALRTLGDLYLARLDVALARTSYDAILRIARDRNDQRAEGGVGLGGMADLALHEGDKATAIKLLERRL